MYTWLIPNLDINGCFHADPQIIKSLIFTRLRKSAKTVQGYVEDLAEAKLIVVYKTNGDTYLCVPDFVEKQPSLNPDREADPTIPPPTPDQLQSSSGATPLKVKESKDEVKIKQSKVNGGFDIFWTNYPKKVGKGKALESWKRINPSEELLSKMIHTIAWQTMSDQWKKDKGQFIPNPATWLNQERWNDEPTKTGGKTLDQMREERRLEDAEDEARRQAR